MGAWCPRLTNDPSFVALVLCQLNYADVARLTGLEPATP
jgi:hypothetical protein